MIGRLHGILIERQPPEILLDVAGVGYEVHLPMSCFYELPETGVELTLYTHFVVREDAQLLYGFSSKQARALFRELIKVNGVGPKLALGILSGMNTAQFVAAVEGDDISSLVKLPGVGRKTAERLLVEMRDRLKSVSGADLFTPATDAAPLDNTGEPAPVPAADPAEEAICALVALGYKPQQASKVIDRLKQPGLSSEQLIRDALRSML